MTTYTFYIAVILLGAVSLQIARKFVDWGLLAAVASWACYGLACLMLIGTSFTVIGQNSVGHLKRIYLAANMGPGQIIALTGELGPQARILGPGFHVIPLVNVLYEVEELPLFHIPDGSYGQIVAQGGEPLARGQFMATKWNDEEFDRMLEAEYFLTHGGQKGPQLSVLKPGAYRLNRYLFDVEVQDALNINAGEVAVIKSNVVEIDDCPNSGGPMEESVPTQRGSALSLPLVPVGCVGVWEKPLLPGRYYLNREAYMPTMIPTRAQTWVYSGGYEKRLIDLMVDNSGTILQAGKNDVHGST